jgi:hypothetical protein
MNREHVFRKPSEIEAADRVADLFERNPDAVGLRLDNFPKYVRRVPLKRFLAMYEIFKRVLEVKGSIVECGVFRGFGVMTWAKLSAILEPENLTRRIYGFDTFAGFPSLDPRRDASGIVGAGNKVGDLTANSHEELLQLIEQFDKDRYLGHIPKVELVKGDIAETAPAFLESHPHLLVSLLFLDADLYDPTLAALKTFLPRMPRGAIIAFDELDNPKWPGETTAMLDFLGKGRFRLQRLAWDPYIAFAEVE